MSSSSIVACFVSWQYEASCRTRDTLLSDPTVRSGILYVISVRNLSPGNYKPAHVRKLNAFCSVLRFVMAAQRTCLTRSQASCLSAPNMLLAYRLVVSKIGVEFLSHIAALKHMLHYVRP